MPRTKEHKAGSHTSGMAVSEYEKAAELFAREQIDMETVENFDDGSEVVVGESVDVKRLNKEHKRVIADKQAARKRKLDEANIENASSPVKKRNFPLTTVGRMDGAHAVRFHDLVVVKDETGKIFNKPLSETFPALKVTSSQAPVDAGSVVPRPTPIDFQVFEPYEETWSTVGNVKSAAASQPGSPVKPIEVEDDDDKDDIKPLVNPWCSECRCDEASDCPSGTQCAGCGGELHEKTLQDIHEEENPHVSESEEEDDSSAWDDVVECTNALHNALTGARMSIDDALAMVPPRLVRDYTKDFLQQHHRKTGRLVFDSELLLNIGNELLTAMESADKDLNKALDAYATAWEQVAPRESVDE